MPLAAGGAADLHTKQAAICGVSLAQLSAPPSQGGSNGQAHDGQQGAVVVVR